MHVAMGEDGGRDDGHVWQRGIAEEDGVEALGDGEGDGVRGLAAAGAGAVIAPVGGGAVRVDEGKLELAGTVEVHWRRADGDSPLVVDH